MAHMIGRVVTMCLSVAILHSYFCIIIGFNYGINKGTTRFSFKRRTCRRILEIFKCNWSTAEPKEAVWRLYWKIRYLTFGVTGLKKM